MEADVQKKISCLLLSFVLCLGLFSGCKKQTPPAPKPNPRTLTVYYYKGVYGSKWIEDIAGAYRAKHPDVTIILKGDQNLDKKAGGILESYNDEPDILFLPNTNWEVWASKGYLDNLTDLFNSKVDGKTLKSKIVPDYLTHCTYGGKYWAVPWEDGVTGFVYNKTMFSQNGWQVPKTMQEFYALLPKIKAAGIVPIAWDGADIGDWGNIVEDWWAQAEGRGGMETYLRLSSPGVYQQNGRADALMLYGDIVSDKSNGMQNAITANRSNSFGLFFSSKAAMLPGGSWTECEAGSQIPRGFEMGLMRAPAVGGAKDPDIDVAAAGGFAVVPQASQHASIAKDFLRFMSSDAMLDLYTRDTSSPRPFIYDTEDVEGLSDFGRSAMDIFRDDDSLYMFSSNPLYYDVFGDWPATGAPYVQIYSGLTTPEMAVEENYNYALYNWSSAQKSLKK